MRSRRGRMGNIIYVAPVLKNQFFAGKFLSKLKYFNSHFREHQLQYVDSVNTTHGNEGWLIFNMISPFSNWVAIPSLNLGIYIAVTPHSNPSKYYTYYRNGRRLFINFSFRA